MSPSAETGYHQVPPSVLPPANVSTSPAPTPQATVAAAAAAASLYQGRALGPTLPYTLTNGSATATVSGLHADLSYTTALPTAVSQPSFVMTPTGKSTAHLCVCVCVCVCVRMKL